MKIEIFENSTGFLARTRNALLSREVEYGLIYSIAERLKHNSRCYGKENPWYFAVTEGSEILSAFLRTPPYNLIFAYFSGDLDILSSPVCEFIINHYGSMPGITGEAESSKKLADTYCRLTGTDIRKTMNQRIYRLDSLNPLKLAEGRLRKAAAGDRDTLESWSRAFAQEALGKKEHESGIDEMVREGTLFVWETEKIKTMAAICRPVLHGISISLVYTPIEYRKQGYATAIVHSLCRMLLDSGYKYCTLYTDLANPVSNSIYVKIGFVPMYESIQIDFF